MGELENIFKRFHNTQALDGLSIKIFSGVNGLIGPNGAGKSTTIKIILSLVKANSGKAELFGFDCWKESFAIRQRVGVLFEKTAFYDHLSGLEHLVLMSKLRGISNPIEESKAVLRSVELENEAQYRRIGSYSAGMRQRIGLAHALLGKPELVILDEPTSNLDPIGRIHVIEIINSLKKDGVSFLISSHILPELEKVCDNVVFMNKGRAIRQETLTQLTSKSVMQSFSIKVHPPEPLVKLLIHEECVKEAYIDNGQIIVIANNAKTFKRLLPSLIAQVGASLEEVKVIGNDLESLFNTAIKGGG